MSKILATQAMIEAFNQNVKVFNEVVTGSSAETTELDSEGNTHYTLTGLDSLYSTSISENAEKIQELVDQASKITVSENEPTNEDGKDGDIWFVLP